MNLGTIVETTVIVLLTAACLFYVFRWISADNNISDLEDELLLIRQRERNFSTINSIHDEYTLYHERMAGHKYVMSYQDWLIDRIAIETEEYL